MLECFKNSNLLDQSSILSIKMFEIVRKYFSIIIAVDGSFTSIYIIGREARVISMRNERANDPRNGL